MLLTDNITTVPSIGIKYSILLEKLNIFTIKDLLEHYPVYYKDTSKIGQLNTLSREEKRIVSAKIISLKNIRTRGGKFIQKGILSDDESQVEVMWFNQPYLIKSIPLDTYLIISGKLDSKKIKPVLISPEFEKEDLSLHMGRIAPFYALTQGISQRWIRTRINQLVGRLDEIENFEDYLMPSQIINFDLIEIKQALVNIHAPNLTEDIILARKRLGFDELLRIQERLINRRRTERKKRAMSFHSDESKYNQIIKKLPFELTKSQNKAIKEIHDDIETTKPMKRLLQGDVGSGKTIVTLLGFLPVLESGFQTVFLAPTTILATQHYKSIQSLLGKEYSVGLVTSTSKPDVKTNYDILVGTHALLANKEKYIKKLGLLVIDEQHRFGVKQRRELLKLTITVKKPHLLQLTATPIPRSVALTLFGEYDVSKIYPPEGRLRVQTYVVPENKRIKSIEWIKKTIDNNGQVFWIAPMIEESEVNSETTSVLQLFPQVKKYFPKYKIKMLHGKLKNSEKEKIIKDFHDKKFQILVSTTVVEVGIDIPNANLIVIESAERFGLAQLHQLRGRVGRNNQKAWCLLYYNENSQEAEKRLKYFAAENDGIKIAKYDLQRRGPGEVYGTMQSGIPNLKIAKYSNIELMELSLKAAKLLFSK